MIDLLAEQKTMAACLNHIKYNLVPCYDHGLGNRTRIPISALRNARPSSTIDDRFLFVHNTDRELHNITVHMPYGT